MALNQLKEAFEINGVKITAEVLDFVRMTQSNEGVIFQSYIDSMKNVLFYAIKQSIEDGVFESIQCSTVIVINFLDELKEIKQ